MRELISHQVNQCNEGIKITVLDEPGSGGAHYEYAIDLVGGAPDSGGVVTRISFQNGPIKEVGVNGLTHEALMAVVIDRLQCFQAGPFACRENALALTKLEEAMHWLHHRTRARQARGVEGTHEK